MATDEMINVAKYTSNIKTCLNFTVSFTELYLIITLKVADVENSGSDKELEVYIKIYT